MIKKAVFITCDDKYVSLSIVALKRFQFVNKEYDMYIIGTTFNEKNYVLTKKYDVHLLTINLKNDFINLNDRPYGKQYPIECFYHFYAYKLLLQYDYIVNIEPDIYTNKKLDINFSLINYIAGSHNNVAIKKFTPLMNDFKKISSIYKKYDINQLKITGGFRIYNTKNLNKINFYNTIITYYKKCIELKSPRCGDDTLMVMYQMLNKEHVYVLEPNFNYLILPKENYIKTDNINKIYFFHFSCFIKKYWINTTRIGLDKYFYDKFVEFIYNNFDSNFIKQHIPSIYIDITNVKIPFYYYNVDNNFGDLVTPYFLKKYCNNNDYILNIKDNYDGKKIISCGSIMRLCNKKTLVYGSGIRDLNQDINDGIIKIVRGPLTRNRLIDLGYYCPPVYGDPGLLLPLYYKPTISKKYKLGILPHIIHYNKIKNIYNNEKNILIIDLSNPNIEKVIDQILSCHKVISSSLHGLIVSDAYNIPNKWIQFDNNIKGDNTKFLDYFKSVNRKDQSYINNFGYNKLNLDKIIDEIENVNISYNINELSENMFFNKNGIKNYTKYLFKNIK